MTGRIVPRATRVWTMSRSSSSGMKCSHSRPTAPRSTASLAWTCPSLTWPGTQQKRSPGTTLRLSWVMPPTSTVEGSPTDSITSMSSKRRFMGTVRMVDPTALHASDTPASRPQQVCERRFT